jgi:tetratricopeptide (TPR) repeat protein
MIAKLSQYDELYWALTNEQRERALELGPELFGDDRAAWAMVRTHLYWLRGEKPKARAWADTARLVFEEQFHEAPADPQDLAIRDGKRALEMLPPSKDMYFGPYIQHQLVRIYLPAGEYDAALDQLQPLLEMPYTLTPAWLRIDPMFDPLRKHPRFVQLVQGVA